MTNKAAFDLWWAWADKPLDSLITIPAEIHDAVMALPLDERRDRARVNAAVVRPDFNWEKEQRATVPFVADDAIPSR